jgi:hypothetical protein
LRVEARIAALALSVLAIASPVAAKIRLYSYDPANAETRQAAGPLTFEFIQELFSTKLLNVRSTEAQATADLKPAGAVELGSGGLSRLIGAAPERDLYEVRQSDDGSALISAFCPGSHRAWMVFPRLRFDRDVRVYVLGDAPADAVDKQTRLCRTFDFSFHGEWTAPPGITLKPLPIAPPQFPPH